MFAFNPAHHHNMQDLGILEVDLRVLELDLRFRGGLGSSPTLKFSSPTANPRTSDFSFGLELPSPYLELGTWMPEEY